MSGRSSRSKGARGELELCKILQEHGIDAQRVPRSGADKTLPWGGDIRGVEALGFHFEVKRQERLNLHAALNQAKNDCHEGQDYLVAFRRSREPWYVCMELEAFLRLTLERRAA